MIIKNTKIANVKEYTNFVFYNRINLMLHYQIRSPIDHKLTPTRQFTHIQTDQQMK